VSPMRYELGIYIPEDILHSDSGEPLKSSRVFSEMSRRVDWYIRSAYVRAICKVVAQWKV
jgi:hypothetical protein